MNWSDVGAYINNATQEIENRLLIIVSLEHTQALDVGAALLPSNNTLRVSHTNQEAPWTSIGNPREFLGREFSGVVYDAYEKFNPDVFGILSGTVTAGSVFVLVIPPIIPEGDHGYYLQRFRRLALQSSDLIVISPTDSPSSIVAQYHTLPFQKPDAKEERYKDQTAAIAQICQVFTGQRKRPTILVADRGRGKSATLGLAARNLIIEHNIRIVVTSSQRSAATSLFKHLEPLSPEQLSHIQWHSVETLLTDSASCDLLLIDEAAGIPLEQLELLLKCYPRIAMATTVHGYEGTGRGFMLRFVDSLRRLTRGWQLCEMHQPIRWHKGDSLEKVTHELLMLNAELESYQPVTANLNGTHFECVSKAELVKDESQLRQLFSLLVLAHYKTRPNDLMQLLDDPKTIIFRLRHDQQNAPITIAVALVVLEGNLSDVDRASIFRGTRRPKGHGLPGLFASAIGIPAAAALKMGRIMRIVVHPDFQRQVVGTTLLNNIAEYFNYELDLLGTNFSLHHNLIRFWRSAGYKTVRIGLSKTVESGAQSGVMVRPISEKSQELCNQAEQLWSSQFPAQLGSHLQQLDATMVFAAMDKNPAFDKNLSNEELYLISSFCYGSRPHESLPQALTHMICKGLSGGSASTPSLLIERILQGKPWSACSDLNGSQGQKVGIAFLRKEISVLLELHYFAYSKQFRDNYLN